MKIFHEFYQQLCKEFRQNYKNLLHRLTIENQIDYLLLEKVKARECIAEFKYIESQNLQHHYVIDESNSSNIRTTLEYEIIDGTAFEKPYTYKKGFKEYLGSHLHKMDIYIGLTNTGLYHYYIPLLLETFYWSKHKWNEGSEIDSCAYLITALKFIEICMGNDTKKYISRTYKLKRLYFKYNSYKGGKNKNKDYETLKYEIKRILNEHKPLNGWKTIKAAIDDLEEHVMQLVNQRLQNLKKKDDADTWPSLHETIRKWSSKDLKDDFAVVVKAKTNKL